MKASHSRWLDLRMTLLFWGLIFTLGLRLISTNWVDDLDLILYIASLAVIIGLALGQSRFSSWLAIIINTIYGLIIIVLVFGLSLDVDLAWYDRIVNILWFRLRFSVSQYAQGQIVQDAILFQMILAVLFWIITSFGAYMLTRHGSVWAAIVPTGIGLMVISYYDSANFLTSTYILFFMVFVLFMIGRANILHMQRNWLLEGAQPTSQVAIDLRKTLMIAVILILFVSWAIPLTSFEVERYSKFWKDFSAPWKKLQERVSDIFGPIEYEATVSNDSFGNFLNLGQSINLGSNTIFVAESSHGENWDLPYYWRAQTYDVFLEDRWFAGDGLESEFISPQNFQFPQSNNKSRERIEFSVEMKTFQETNIYIVNEPVYVSRPVEIVSFFSAGDSQEIVSVFANPPMQSGEIYQVHALVPNPTRVELRETGMEYLDWVDRYLQLPPDFPEEIRQLALEITQQETNPFDKSQAITRYLRNTITYEEVLPEIPANQDPIAWFLFTHRAGFCNYYATAQVLMLRSIGIPARLAVGYAQGEFDQLTGIFTVKQKDRHAWPEVYFNEYGWIEFEPTTAQPNIERPIGQISEATIESRILPEMEEETPVIETATPEPTIEVVQDIQVKQESGTYVLLFLISLFLLAILASYFVLWLVTPQIRVTPISNILSNIYNKLSISEPEWLKNWSAKQAQKPFKQAYKSIGNAIKHLGGKMNKSDTPSERGKLLLKLLPDYKNDIEDLIYQYELAKFSPHQADIQKANASSLKIKKAVQVYILENRFIKNK